MATHSIVLAGFGGQGILFAGKLIAYAGMKCGKEVSWLPSYGPEMRGGTASCFVTISDEPVTSPIIQNPDVLIVFNLPSIDKYEESVSAGGNVIADSAMISRTVERGDVKAAYIPATQMAVDMEAPGLANMVMVGKAIREIGFLSLEDVKKAMLELVPKAKQELAQKNIAAIEAGYNF